MKKLILVAICGASLSGFLAANEAPSAVGQWTASSLREALAQRPVGDVSRGEQLNSAHMCASCHGDKGVPPTPRWPATAGQLESYTYKMLLDYKDQARLEDDRANVMTAVAEMLSKRDMSDLAAYYASLEAPVLADKPVPALVRDGDPERLITPCASCHGLNGQGGIKGTPAIAGQSVEVLKRALEFYQSGERTSDLYSVMGQAALRLTADEIDALANYYSGHN